MKVLGIETTGERLSIGVTGQTEMPATAGRQIASLQCSCSEKENIIEIIKDSRIKLEEIDGIAVSIGPGSFTGMRVGLAVAKGLAISLNKPIVGIPVLDAFMPGIKEQLTIPPEVDLPTAEKSHSSEVWTISPIIDAKKERIYTAMYEFHTDSLQWERVSSFWVMKVDEFLESIEEERILVGNGVSIYREKIKKAGKKVRFIEPNIEFPTGVWVAILGSEKLMRGEQDSIDELDGIYI